MPGHPAGAGRTVRSRNQPAVYPADAAALVADTPVRARALPEQQQCFGHFCLPGHHPVSCGHCIADSILGAV